MNTDLMFDAFLTEFKKRSVRNSDLLLCHLLWEMKSDRNEPLEGLLKSIFNHITEPENATNRIHGTTLAYQIILKDAIEKSSIFKQMFVDYYTLQTM